MTFIDDRIDYGEQRLIALGYPVGRFVVVVHAPFADGTRIISMRKGNRLEAHKPLPSTGLMGEKLNGSFAEASLLCAGQ